ncbi:MAG: prolipoprotein diacylglyceryl transferase [Clostridia bacterium]|nr:prolipoprotein diacylglyceryl transferase [Clostridia bacterium]
MNWISFPGLGIEPFRLNKTAFTVFGRPVAWYGIIICFGIILAVLYSMWRGKKSEGISTDDVTDLAIFLMIFGFLGARIYYVAFEFDQYRVTGEGFFGNVWGTLKNSVKIWEGGIAIYGGLIAGFVTVLIFCKVKKIKLLKMVDVAAPAAMIGQPAGRWGNCVNAEAHGGVTTLPWKMGIMQSKFESAPIGDWTYYHPTFLYESIWNLIGFGIANILYKKKKFDGEIFFFYIAWYGLGRAFIEGMRTDSLWIGHFRVSQLVGAATFVTGVVLFIVFAVKNRKEVDEKLEVAAPAVEVEDGKDN